MCIPRLHDFLLEQVHNHIPRVRCETALAVAALRILPLDPASPGQCAVDALIHRCLCSLDAGG